jgi:REP element-mobilizing transposase RayT
MTVFHRKAEYELFLEKLEHFAGLFRVRVFCYCCMGNHFHLYVRTEEANLSRFMQSFLTSFTVSLNRARETSGHVFQGRFKAHLVEEEAYHTELSRYIHLNPVRVRGYRHRSVKERRAHLRRFQWSSYAPYIGLRRAPEWLTMEPVLAEWSGSTAERMRQYRRFVEEGLVRELKSPYAGSAEQSLVGSDSFVDRIKRAYLLGREGNRREEPSLVHLQESFSLEEITEAVAGLYEIESAELVRRRCAHREARRLLMYLASKYCRHESSLSELAERLGVSVSGLTRARDRVAAALPGDRELRRLLQTVQERIESPPSQ